MKLTSVEIHSPPTGPAIELSFRDPKALNPYNIKSIQGLDANLLIPKYAGVTEVTKLYNLALNKRDVVIQTGLNPDYADNESYSDLRDDLYRIISSTRTGLVQLRFLNLGVVVASISGFISKFEAQLFEKELEVELTLSCKESMLKTLDRVAYTLTGGNPATTVLEDTKSTAPHGFIFVLQFSGAVSSLTIGSASLGSTFTIRPRGGFLSGDKLYFSSEFDNRYIYILRGSTVIPLADVVDRYSIWPILFPGENTFQVSSGALSVFTEISHYETYWGV